MKNGALYVDYQLINNAFDHDVSFPEIDEEPKPPEAFWATSF